MSTRLRADHAADWRARLRGSRAGTLLVLAVTTVAVMVGAYLMRPAPPAQTATVTAAQVGAPADGPAPQVGSPAPAFSATDVDGRPVSSTALRGRAVWLTFGATWCANCRAESPDIQAAHATGGSRAAVVAVYLNEGPDEVREYAQRLGLTFTHVADPRTTLAASYRVQGVPAHFFIDRDGILRSTAVGILSPDQIHTHLAAIGG